MSTEQELICFFKALSDENRIRIFRMLQGGEKCACRLLEELNISQPTLSHHMKILFDAGIVTGRKEGKWIHYSIRTDGVMQIKNLMRELLSEQDPPENCACKEV